MEKALGHHNLSDKSNPTVLGITGNNWSRWQEQTDILKNIDVIIITHSRYIALCLDDDLRLAFSERREVLIIDEKINFPTYSFSEVYYENIRRMLPSIVLKDEFDKICKDLRIILEKQQTANNQNLVIRMRPSNSKDKIQHFLELINLNINDIKDLTKRSAIQNCAQGIEQWYSTMCIYNGGNIITFNRKHRLWGLKNNIILDASSNIDGVYHISEDYNVVSEKRIIDHSNSTFHIIPFNTGKGNIKKHETEYFKEIAKKIKHYHKENDQTLIICHKDNFPLIEEQLLRLSINDIHVAKVTIEFGEEKRQIERVKQSFAINWFGNIIGKNEYTDFSNCWIIGTPNIPLGQYPIQYMMYSKQKDLTNKKLELIQGSFKNKIFNELKNGYVASEIYQSLKRIQRNVLPNGNFFIVNNNKTITDLVLGEIKGVKNIEEIELDFVQKKKQESESNYIDLFIDYMRELPIGEYPKKDITKKLNIIHLYRVLKADRVKQLETYGYIKIKGKSIEKIDLWSK
ncbi:hypothetical protein [Psychrobacillus psychrotolerans]|uniref:hypothetical protein n=1 Tax=Psychrobacillus psychrotolerans TaxID=126156 RepID=UPI0033156678